MWSYTKEKYENRSVKIYGSKKDFHRTNPSSRTRNNLLPQKSFLAKNHIHRLFLPAARVQINIYLTLFMQFSLFQEVFSEYFNIILTDGYHISLKIHFLNFLYDFGDCIYPYLLFPC